MISSKSLQKSSPLFISIVISLISFHLCLTGYSYADQKSWKDEFNTLCGDTHKSMTLGKDDLMVLVERCNKLTAEIDATDSPQKKAYLFRIKKCRNFYQYIIETIKTERLK